MQQNAPVRTKLLTLIMAGVAGLGFAAVATAAKIAGGVNAHVSANHGVTAPVRAEAGGTADAHMSAAGLANSNAQWQSGATRGADRAAERMNMNGAEMQQSAGAELEASGKAAAGKR
jgi:hypothetical protein